MMTNAVDLAERKGNARASVYLFFAATILLLLLASFGPRGSDFFKGMWLGVTLIATLNLLPFARWLRPGSAVARLLDDESAREHQRTSSAAGFVAAMTAALAMTFVTAETDAISAIDAARLIGTAAMVARLVSFATLELRASRG